MRKETKSKILRSLIVAGVLIAIVLAIFLPLYFSGALAKIKSAEELQKFILSGGGWSYAIFFTIQFLQVTFLPVPAAVTTVAGTLVFGPWITCAISFAAVMLASIFSFFLGRKVGKKLVIWVAGEKDYQKWAEKLGKGKYVFFLMMLFPVFPDDILCMVVGTTNMTWKFFLLTNLITRPIGIFCTCFLSSGIIPFTGWWIALWVVLALACIALFVLCYKYQPQIENFILKLAHKFERKKEKTAVVAENEKTEPLKHPADISQQAEEPEQVKNSGQQVKNDHQEDD
ncbi:MAG: TVP38/TMEM64 family protein [Clostridia bacterium]|nr:TVP38/TMEM64 family protein [Clostridia bacterium]